MKLVKFVPVIAATLVLAACSTASNVVSGVTDTASNAVNATTDAVKGAKDAITAQPTFETAAYECQAGGKKVVLSTTYAFVNGKPSTATVRVNKKTLAAEMKFDPSYKDGVQFVEGKKTWTLAEGFAAGKVNKTEAIMFVDNNEIQAKYCKLITK